MAEPRRIKLWMLILAGPFLIASGLHSYFKLAEFEESGGRIYINKLDKLFYNAGGKTTVLLVWCGLGAIYLFAVYRYFTIQRESSAQIADAEARIAAANGPVVDEVPLAPTPPVERPLPPAPRIGDDPFRDPPGPKPLLIKKAELLAAPAPRASTPELTDPEDRPKFLK
jgi:hypothetical protein